MKELVARSCKESAPESLRDRVRIKLHEVEIHFTDGTSDPWVCGRLAAPRVI